MGKNESEKGVGEGRVCIRWRKNWEQRRGGERKSREAGGRTEVRKEERVRKTEKEWE